MVDLKRSITMTSVPSGASVTSRSKKPSLARSFSKSKLFHRRAKSDPTGAGHDGEQTESSTRGTCPSPILTPASDCLVDSASRDTLLISNATVNVDGGAPSPSVLEDLQRVLRLIEAERHLVAHNLLLDTRRRIQKSRDKKSSMQRKNDRNKVAKGLVANRSGLKGSWWGVSELDGISNDEGDFREKMTDEDRAWNLLQEKQDEFQALESRAHMFINAKENLSIDDDWTLAQTMFGITTHFRREADESLSIKIEGELHGIPLFEQLVVLRECDLYHTWAPFTQKSQKLAQLNKLDVVAWYIVGVPMLGLTRDVCYRAVGCDCMRENGSVLLVAVGLNDSVEHGVKDGITDNRLNGITEKNVEIDSGDEELETVDVKSNSLCVDEASIAPQQRRRNFQQHTDSNLIDTTASSFLTRDAILETIEIPPIPQGMGRGRMTIRNFSASIDVLGPTSARTKMVVNIDPNLHFIPQSLIDFCMKRMCGILLSRLQATARKVVKDPIKNPHSRRMREDVRFYRDWLLPKFRLYCNELGWEMPPVGAFSVSEKDLEADGIFEGWREDDNTRSSQTRQYNGDEISINTSLACGRESSSSSSSSKGTYGTRMGKLGNFLDFEHRASKKRELKITEARRQAEKLLQPVPFSESEALRLKELKDAKFRAEERVRTKSFDSSAASVSSYNTLKELDENKGFTQLMIFISSFIANLSLLPLRRYTFSNVPPSCQGPSLSFSQLPSCMAPDLLALFMVVLQAVSLWALLNSVLVFAFDSIDFGQKNIVKNLDRGKRLYINAVKKYSTMISVFIIAISISIAVAGYLFQRSMNNLCSLLSNGVLYTFSRWWRSFLLRINSSDHPLASKTALHYFDALGKAVSEVIDWVNYLAFQIPIKASIRKFSAFLNLISCTLIYIIPRSLRRVATILLDFFAEYMVNSFPSDIDICYAKKKVINSWRKNAVEISSFITIRLGVFVLALLLMSYLILPKPEKKLRKIGKAPMKPRINSDGVSQSDSVAGGSSVSSNTNLRGFSLRDISSMDVITEE